MAKIGVNVDSFVEILTFYPKAFPALGKLISLLDLEGASSINASLVSGQKGYSLKMLEFVQKLYGGLLNVYTDIDSNNIQQVLQMQPTMLTVTGGFLKTRFQQPVDIQLYGDQLREIITELNAHDVVSCIAIEPSVEALKKVHRAGFEYIEISSLAYASADSYNDEMESLQRILEIANMAENLGLGVRIRGDIGTDNIAEILQIKSIEEVVLEDRFFQNSIFQGISAAFQAYMRMVRH
jgi:pyridoxine 5'-phosphate synthase PdxJ